ncbi:MAG: Mth938-like domain-containing protein [Formosimonas sp.]
MHFQPDINPEHNNLTGIDAQAIKVNQVAYPSSIVLTPTGEVHSIAARHTHEIDAQLWHSIAAQNPEVVLIGTGAQQKFISPAILAPLHNARIGVECMTSGAAARTFNVLMSEGRRVLALILLPEETS